MSERATITVLAGRKSSGVSVYEEILVDKLSENKFLLIATPGMVLGIAAGDVIEMRDEGGGFDVVRRGGNLAIQIYGDNSIVDEHLDELASLSQQIDGRVENITIMTVSLKKHGFALVEKTLNEFCSRHEGVQWYYGNVYDPKDGITPLNWWVGPSPVG